MFRISALLIGIGTVTLLAQEALPASPELWERLVVQGGAVAILGFAVMWYMTRTIPTMQQSNKDMIEAHAAERDRLLKKNDDQRREFLERMDAWTAGAREDSKQAREDSKQLNDTLRQMTLQCQTVTGKFNQEKT